MRKNSSASRPALGSNRTVGRLVRAAVCLGVAAALSAPLDRALAQSGASGEGAGGRALSKTPSRILIISVQRLGRNSKAGRSITEQAEALRAEILAPIEAKQAALRKEEEELARLKSTMAKDAFEARVEAFKVEWRAVRRDEQAAIARLQYALREATRSFHQARNTVLTGLMERYDGAVMLDEAAVVLSANALNVTQEAIAKLDATVDRVEVKLPPIDE